MVNFCHLSGGMVFLVPFGCYIGSQFFGCIMYADDLIMLSPSLKGLQSMFNLYDAYAKTHFLIFNAKKRSLCE